MKTMGSHFEEALKFLQKPKGHSLATCKHRLNQYLQFKKIYKTKVSNVLRRKLDKYEPKLVGGKSSTVLRRWKHPAAVWRNNRESKQERQWNSVAKWNATATDWEAGKLDWLKVCCVKWMSRAVRKSVEKNIRAVVVLLSRPSLMWGVRCNG